MAEKRECYADEDEPERLGLEAKSRVLADLEEVRDDRGVDQREAEKLARKMKSGKSFDLNDFKMQFQQMKNSSPG